MSTIQIADKTTLDNTKTNTTNLLARGGIKYNATSQKYQTYNTTNSSWVDTEFGGGSGSPTLIIKNIDGILNNKSITVSNISIGFTSTKSMESLDYLVFDVPLLGEYIVTDGTKTTTCNVDSIGGVACPFVYLFISFASGTESQIANMLDAHYSNIINISDIWAVGDTRTIHLDAMQAPNPTSSNTWLAQDITVAIIDFDHTELETPINGHTKAAITVQTREVLSGTSAGTAGYIYINGDSSSDTPFKKWSDLYMRNYLNNNVYGAMSSIWKKAIKSSIHYRHTNYNTTGAEQVIDNLFLPSYPEIYGTASISYYTATSPTEGDQFDYYKTSSNRIKYPNNNGVANDSGYASYWWTGSASSYYSSSYYFYWFLITNNGYASYENGRQSYALAPAWAM